VSVLFEQGRGHMVGSFPALEDELCLWTPGDPSPNRLDAMVWAGYWLIVRHRKKDRPSVRSRSLVSG
jgi:phage terminase large subunit-like protein